MGLESIQEGATNPVIPFIGEESLSLGLIVALFAGFVLLAIVRPASESAAEWLAAMVQQIAGVNLQTGETSGPAAGAFA